MAQQLLPAPPGRAALGRKGRKFVFKTAPSRFLVFPDGLAVWGCLLMPFTERALPEIWEMGTNAKVKNQIAGDEEYRCVTKSKSGFSSSPLRLWDSFYSQNINIKQTFPKMPEVESLSLQRKLLIQCRVDLCPQEMGVWRKSREFLGKESLDEPGPPKGCAVLQMVVVGPSQLSCLTLFCPFLSVPPHRDLILHPQPLENLHFLELFPGRLCHSSREEKARSLL